MSSDDAKKPRRVRSAIERMVRYTNEMRVASPGERLLKVNTVINGETAEAFAKFVMIEGDAQLNEWLKDSFGDRNAASSELQISLLVLASHLPLHDPESKSPLIRLTEKIARDPRAPPAVSRAARRALHRWRSEPRTFVKYSIVLNNKEKRQVVFHRDPEFQSVSDGESANEADPAPTKPGIRWAPEHQLENIKVFSPAVVADDRRESGATSAAAPISVSKVKAQMTSWKAPVPIALPEECVVHRGTGSEQALEQAVRDASVLEVVYFNRDLVPPNPSASDTKDEPEEPIELVRMNLKDLAAPEAVEPLPSSVPEHSSVSGSSATLLDDILSNPDLSSLLNDTGSVNLEQEAPANYDYVSFAERRNRENIRERHDLEQLHDQQEFELTRAEPLRAKSPPHPPKSSSPINADQVVRGGPPISGHLAAEPPALDGTYPPPREDANDRRPSSQWLCRFVLTPAGCVKGDQCNFSHDVPGMDSAPPAKRRNRYQSSPPRGHREHDDVYRHQQHPQSASFSRLPQPQHVEPFPFGDQPDRRSSRATSAHSSMESFMPPAFSDFRQEPVVDGRSAPDSRRSTRFEQPPTSLSAPSPSDHDGGIRPGRRPSRFEPPDSAGNFVQSSFDHRLPPRVDHQSLLDRHSLTFDYRQMPMGNRPSLDQPTRDDMHSSHFEHPLDGADVLRRRTRFDELPPDQFSGAPMRQMDPSQRRPRFDPALASEFASSRIPPRFEQAHSSSSFGQEAFSEQHRPVSPGPRPYPFDSSSRDHRVPMDDRRTPSDRLGPSHFDAFPPAPGVFGQNPQSYPMHDQHRPQADRRSYRYEPSPDHGPPSGYPDYRGPPDAGNWPPFTHPDYPPYPYGNSNRDVLDRDPYDRPPPNAFDRRPEWPVDRGSPRSLSSFRPAPMSDVEQDRGGSFRSDNDRGPNSRRSRSRGGRRGRGGGGQPPKRRRDSRDENRIAAPDDRIPRHPPATVDPKEDVDAWGRRIPGDCGTSAGNPSASTNNVN